MRTSSLLLLILLSFIKLHAQNSQKIYQSSEILNEFKFQKRNNRTKWGIAQERSASGDSYQFMALRRDFGFINEMLYAGERSVIEQGITLIDSVIKSSKQSSHIRNNKTFRDQYKGWITLFNNSEKNKEVPLYESYSFFYITQFLYILQDIGWVSESQKNKIWWDQTLNFVEENIWHKWLERSMSTKRKKYWYFLRQRTHMGSHWAGIAMYLGALTKNQEIKNQTKEVQRQYDLLLKRNLRTVNNAYIWHSTYDNVLGTDASTQRKSIIQDVSHGNHVVAYIVAAYEFGNKNWTKTDIDKLCNTLIHYMYNNKTNRFSDNVDGTSDGRRPGWGNFVADGWVKLLVYDDRVRKIFDTFETPGILNKYSQEMQFKSVRLKNQISK